MNTLSIVLGVSVSNTVRSDELMGKLIINNVQNISIDDSRIRYRAGAIGRAYPSADSVYNVVTTVPLTGVLNCDGDASMPLLSLLHTVRYMYFLVPIFMQKICS